MPFDPNPTGDLKGDMNFQELAEGLDKIFEGGVTINDLEVDVDFLVKALSGVVGLFVDGATGRVGVGTASPAQKLHVFKSADENVFLLVQNLSTGASALGGLRAQADVAVVNFQAHGSGRTATRFGKAIASWNEFLGVSGNGILLGTLGAVPVILGTAGVSRLEIDGSGNIGINGSSYGGGAGVLFLGDRTTAPTSNPSGGGILYCEGGALKYRGSSGTVTTIAPA